MALVVGMAIYTSVSHALCPPSVTIDNIALQQLRRDGLDTNVDVSSGTGGVNPK